MSGTDTIGFVLKMARAMHSYGYAAHRLEEALGAVAQRLGLEAQFFSTPTSIFAAFGPQDDQHTYLLRVEPGETDLGKLAQVDRVTLRVIRGEITPADGSRELDAIVAAGPAYGPAVTVSAFGIASAGAARFLSGGPAEIVLAGLLGIVTGALALLAAGRPRLGRIFEPLAAFVVTAIATWWAVEVQPVSVNLAVLGGLIVLIPGFTLTVSMTELATRHLVSGTARLSSALLLFLTILFGFALGGRVAGLIVRAPEVVQPAPLPLWTELIALAVAPVAFAVLLRADRGDFGWIMAAGWLAFGAARAGATWFGPELGAFFGALTAGVAANLYAYVRDRPSQILLVPAVLLLVPGSIGFRSVAAMLQREVISGVETAFTMAFIATALVCGLLVANVVVPRRRSE